MQIEDNIQTLQTPESTPKSNNVDIEEYHLSSNSDDVNEDEIKAEEDKNETPELPPNHLQFGMDEEGNISDLDIRQMLFLFAVNENIPIRYKKMIAKIIKLGSYKNQDKINIFNTIGYVWDNAKEKNDITEIQKIILVRKLYKQIFGSYYDD
jgi:hypothetical protein